jgi:actin-like ATPase involved in cell morphogenesis
LGYALGVDLGTTYTAAATYRDGRVEITGLGNRSAAIPSVVLLREDEEVLTGETANRRGLTEPDRLAREFKRRVGDTNPIFLGGAPYSAEALMARLLQWVIAAVSERQGGEPDALAISHPANWGQYKKDLLAQAVRLADLKDATYLSEPEAAAIHYASQERVEPGEIVAVYDLGGGTFDAAVLRKTADGFEILGTPEGIERLGGIDFDAAVYHHVARSLEGALEQLDEDDPAAMAAAARLRQECIEAKEALSTDTDVSIPVLLPNIQTEVRLTRAEFEAMIRPSLQDSTRALRRALDSAGVAPEQVSAVLLVGGSSRIPLVAQMVSADLGRPVAVDADPKHAIALGTALAAAQAGGLAKPAAAPVVAPPPAEPEAASGGALAAAAAGAAAGVAGAAAAEAITGDDAAAAPAEPVPAAAGSPPPAPPTPPPPTPAPTAPVAPTAPAEPAAAGAPPAAPPTEAEPAVVGSGGPMGPRVEYTPPRPGDGPPTGAGGKKKKPVALIVAAVVILLLLIGGGIVLASGGGDDGGEEDVQAGGDTEVTEAPSDDTGSDDTEPVDTGAAVTDCDVGSDNTCIVDASLDGDTIVVEYETAFTEDPGMSDPAGRHQHFFFNPPTEPDAAGSNAPDFGLEPGDWEVWASGSPFTSGDFTMSQAQAVGAGELCVRPAFGGSHAFTGEPGNCVDLSSLG